MVSFLQRINLKNDDMKQDFCRFFFHLELILCVRLDLLSNSRIAWSNNLKIVRSIEVKKIEFLLLVGSSTPLLSRKFVEFCILGTDNLPRTLLMYMSNTPSSTSVYFPTLLCNSHRFNKTTINHSFRYSSLDSRHRARLLNSTDFHDMVKSGAAFASTFDQDAPVLDRIDRELLNRDPNKPVPGGWCLGDSRDDKCGVWGDADVLKPGPGAKRLENRLVRLLSGELTRCVDEWSMISVRDFDKMIEYIIQIKLIFWRKKIANSFNLTKIPLI